MARMKGIEPREASWVQRVAFWFVKRKVRQLTGRARLLEPVQVHAHHSRLLRAYGQMEMGQEAAKSVDASLKSLASIRVAMLVGCPF